MVSLRRRKNLGLCSGKKSFPVELPRSAGIAVENPNMNAKSFSEHPMPSVDLSNHIQINISEACTGSSIASASSSNKEDPVQYFPGKRIKRRKQHRRKRFEDRERSIMRGVYFKNMKWQAAIKVDKKQIHLGTVASQEEAARLYDRAAFMCGREPNFKLDEEEKQELSQYKWDEFLAMTRSAINDKKQHKGRGVGIRRRLNFDLQEGFMGLSPALSDDGDEDTSAS